MSTLQLETAAAVLGPVLEDLVFIGGATIHLWFTEPGAPPARATDDVDVICEVATRAEYYRLGSRLQAQGLHEAVGEPVLCRWRSADPLMVLDVMPTDAEILGFSNPWYDEAISTSVTVVLASGVEIRAATPTALVATKLCAWNGRGKGDILRSLDVHDVLALIDGRPELSAELLAARPDLRGYVREELGKLVADPYFEYAIDSAVAGYGAVGFGRASVLRERVAQIVSP